MLEMLLLRIFLISFCIFIVSLIIQTIIFNIVIINKTKSNIIENISTISWTTMLCSGIGDLLLMGFKIAFK